MFIRLSTIPKQLDELKRSAARAGAIASLSRALAYSIDLDPNEMVGGFPELKDDGSSLTRTDLAHCIKVSRVLATKLASELDSKVYQAAYDDINSRV